MPALENPQELYPKGRIFALRKSAFGVKAVVFRGFFGKSLNGAPGIAPRTFSAHLLNEFLSEYSVALCSHFPSGVKGLGESRGGLS